MAHRLPVAEVPDPDPPGPPPEPLSPLPPVAAVLAGPLAAAPEAAAVGELLPDALVVPDPLAEHPARAAVAIAAAAETPVTNFILFTCKTPIGVPFVFPASPQTPLPPPRLGRSAVRPLNATARAVVYGDDHDESGEHVDRKQTRAFEGFVAESGDTLLRMATLAARWARVTHPMAFCRRVMHNIVIDQARARGRRPRSLGLASAHDSGDPRSGDPVAAVELRPALLGPGVPGELPVARHDSPTVAEFARWPTGPAELRALLLSQANEQNAQAQKQFEHNLSQQPASQRKKMATAHAAAVGTVTDDDLVFEQATDTLWNPLVPPALRSALYKVLAATPGVVVHTHARDLSGRPATEISRVDNAQGETTSTFENPATGAVLESLFATPANPAQGVPGSTYYDLYQSITSSSTLPAHPYQR